MGFASMLRAGDVSNDKELAAFIQQELGTPQPYYSKDWILYRQALKQAFDVYPNADWLTMTKVVAFVKNRHKRIPTAAGVIREMRWAWGAGFLPELDPSQQIDLDLEERIEQALRVETDMDWRSRLTAAAGNARSYVYDMWVKERQCLV